MNDLITAFIPSIHISKREIKLYPQYSVPRFRWLHSLLSYLRLLKQSYYVHDEPYGHQVVLSTPDILELVSTLDQALYRTRGDRLTDVIIGQPHYSRLIDTVMQTPLSFTMHIPLMDRGKPLTLYGIRFHLNLYCTGICPLTQSIVKEIQS